jgi:hypothetical protein
LRPHTAPEAMVIFHASQFGDAAWHRTKLADLLLA